MPFFSSSSSSCCTRSTPAVYLDRLRGWSTFHAHASFSESYGPYFFDTSLPLPSHSGRSVWSSASRERSKRASVSGRRASRAKPSSSSARRALFSAALLAALSGAGASKIPSRPSIASSDSCGSVAAFCEVAAFSTAALSAAALFHQFRSARAERTLSALCSGAQHGASSQAIKQPRGHAPRGLARARVRPLGSLVEHLMRDALSGHQVVIRTTKGSQRRLLSTLSLAS